MSRRTLPRLLLGLITLFATLVDPIASVLHGVAHAAESLHERTHTTGNGVGYHVTGEQGNHSGGDALEAADHDRAHEALHRATMRDATTPATLDAIASLKADDIASPPLITTCVLPRVSDGPPPDFGLRTRDLARAPPLA